MIESAPVGFAERLQHTQTLLAKAATLGRSVLAHSLSAEDGVLFHLIVLGELPIDTMAIDTGLLPLSSYAIWQDLEAHYGRPIRRIVAEPDSLAEGPVANPLPLIYQDRAARMACCEARKVVPLRKALQEYRSWITGLRRAQSTQRAAVAEQSFDANFGLYKFNPLAHWSDADLWFFVHSRRLPLHPLYARGNASIGCEPCTRAIRPDEPIRAGRWWWEAQAEDDHRECGLHLSDPRTRNSPHDAHVMPS